MEKGVAVTNEDAVFPLGCTAQILSDGQLYPSPFELDLTEGRGSLVGEVRERGQGKVEAPSLGGGAALKEGGEACPSSTPIPKPHPSSMQWGLAL